MNIFIDTNIEVINQIMSTDITGQPSSMFPHKCSTKCLIRP